MNGKLCQSCAMPMGDTDELYAVNADGTKSTDYCSYCYDKGAFLSNCTMQEMLDVCAKFVAEENPGMSKESAVDMLKSVIPQLKRWKAE